MILLKIAVKTPKNQAHKSVETQKKALLGYKGARQVIEQRVVANNLFYWIVEAPASDVPDIIKKAAKGEALIRSFYRTLIRILSRANKIAQKSGKGGAWMKRWIIKRMKKVSRDKGLTDQWEAMSDEQFQEFIRMTDRKEIEELIAGEMITVTEL